jgi:lipopolysaccharide transport system ATP-binding protein
MKTVIEISHLSKLYNLGQIGTGTVSRDLERWYKMKIRGQEDPFLKIGETNNRKTKSISDVVYSLKDINLEINQGDALGIIGKNGAGKSTLLKIISRVTSQTTGQIKIKGRVASLLEVGTGFHPELTGRENIFLNGAILGMRKKEIIRKLDEIIDFSDVERYIDTPVKRYSSGMYVRLAFAVAAHLESEIMIVDEVLAVGDAAFQKKCLGKMGDVSKGEGRTVLFVSHNMGAVRQLCQKGIVLTDGELSFSGTSHEAIDTYLLDNQNTDVSHKFEKIVPEGKDIELIYAELLDINDKQRTLFDISEDIVVNLTVLCKKKIPNCYGYIVVKNRQGEFLIETDTFDYSPNCLEDLKVGENKFQVKIKSNILAYGDYIFYITFASSFATTFMIDKPGDILAFSIQDTETQRGQNRTSKTSQLLKWEPQFIVK